MDTREQRGVKVHAMETQVLVTALGPDDPDDGDAGRQMRGLAIAALTTNIRKNRLGYAVPSQSEFLECYHQRSNVETTFAMVKAKFGGSVRAKTPTAQVNEALLKFLCHNIVVLIQSIYELGIAPAFWSEPDCPKSRETAPNLTLNPLF